MMDQLCVVLHISFVLSFCWVIELSSSILGTTMSEDEETNRDGASDSESFSINLRVSESPGREFVRIFGETKSVVDPFSTVHRTAEFLGIPFATPTLGHLRFQRPSLHVPDRDFRATAAPQPCPQIAINSAFLGTEDCLQLNVYLPIIPLFQGNGSDSRSSSSPKLPVLVWFHGESLDRSADGIFGILTSGSARDLIPDVFLTHKILVVTPQYRLGSLGFLSTVNEDLNGNMGLFDQLLALEWVQRFGSDFGGDTNQVTVLGHGSSAITIGLLATSDLGKGLFQRLIMMGGSALSPVGLDSSPRLTFAESALQNGCPSFPTLRFVRCMQGKGFESIVRADESNFKGKHLGKARVPLPVVQRDSDGRFLPPILSTSPASSLAAGNFEHVPIILGVSRAEMGGFLSSIAGRDLSEISTSIFGSNTVLKQFIRALLSRGSFDPDMAADLVSFEYFSGLNISDPARFEQTKDILEEMISDFLYHVPALSLAKLWSRFAPVYFYVFDYVPTGSPDAEEENVTMTMGPDGGQLKKAFDFDIPTAQQASHGSDLRFLMDGYRGSAEDRDLANSMVDFWVNFIHKGSPLHAGLNWPQFREDSKQYLLLNDQVGIESGFRARQEYLWSNLIQDLGRRACLSTSGPNDFGPRPRFNYKNSNNLYQALEDEEPTKFNLDQGPTTASHLFLQGGEASLLEDLPF